jgi:hypothetical protein
MQKVAESERAVVLGGRFYHDLLLPAGLNAGQSLSIRRPSFRQPVNYDDEPLHALQSFFVDKLRGELEKLQLFGRIQVISEVDAPRTDLVIEGLFLAIDEGNRGVRFTDFGGMAGRAQAVLAGAIRRTEGDEEVLCFLTSAPGTAWGWMSGGKRVVRDAVQNTAKSTAEAIKESRMPRKK